MSGVGARVAVVEAPLALYRRYRPETFSEVIGQDHVTVPLRNALSNNRVNHAYLFSGPRGCGKTTSARILARAINCEKGPIAEPCGVCKSCTDLARGGPGSIDVIEIDAASHGGVDDARDLRERAFFAPVESRYKIYIIDEAHMVTTQGFNALLKLVEEPPPHLKFIFATTEPDKVIGTIRSRTHHYPFRLVPPKALADYMAMLCEAEGVTIAPAALPLVVRAGAGSVRDSLSVLDQLIGGADSDGVTYKLAVQLLGFTPDSLLDACVDGFAAHDSRAVFETIEKVIETGQDPKRFAEDLLRRLRDLVILSAVPNAVASGLIEAAEDQGERLQTQAAGIGPAELTRAADIVAAGLLEMRGATAPRLQLELICAKVLLPGADDSTNGIQARLDRMERRLTIATLPAGTTPPAPAAPPAHPSAPQSHAAAPQQPQSAASQQSHAAASQQSHAAASQQSHAPAAQQPQSAALHQSHAPAASGSQTSGANQPAASQTPAAASAGTGGSTQGTASGQAAASAGGGSGHGGASGHDGASGGAGGSAHGGASAHDSASAQGGMPAQGGASSQGGASAQGGVSAGAGGSAHGGASASGGVAAQSHGRQAPASAGDNTGSRSGAWGDEPTATPGGAQAAPGSTGGTAPGGSATGGTAPGGFAGGAAPGGSAGGAAAGRSGPGGAAGSASGGTASGGYAGGAAPGGSGPGGAAAGSAAQAPSAGVTAGASAGAVGLVDVRRLWPEILEAVKAKRRFAWIMLSQNAQVIAIDEQTLTLGLVNAGARESFARSGSDEILRQAMIDTIGLNRRVEAVVDPSSDPGAAPPAAPPPPSSPPSSSWDAPPAGSSWDAPPAAGPPSGGSGGNAPSGRADAPSSPAPNGQGATDAHSAPSTATAPAASGAVATAVQASVVTAGAQAVAVQDAPAENEQADQQAGLQADQQAGGPPAPAASPEHVAENRREQAASKRRAAEAAVAAEQTRRAAQVQVDEAPLTPEEEAEAIGEDDVILEEDSRSHTDLLSETLGAQIISEEPN
ncbi:hypothetical protein GCM10009789_77740 [Kribbella sancticallisti]|uniref:DNA-directed DNA polymerase n=1 Tax=Kribbella sancticallisti TaxID=460087 RepID=A0ABP4QNN0_9ACTN